MRLTTIAIGMWMMCEATVGHASPREWACEGREDLAGECFVVRGRLQPYDGGPPNVRIWPIGSKRLLGVEQSADERINVPPDLEQYVRTGNLVFADFRVCPLTAERSGHMRLVCVERARRIKMKRSSEDGAEPEVIYPADIGAGSNKPLQPTRAAEPFGRPEAARSGPRG